MNQIAFQMQTNQNDIEQLTQFSQELQQMYMQNQKLIQDAETNNTPDMVDPQ